MTSPATFGDFLDAARAQLARISLPEGGEDLRDASQGVRRIVAALSQFAEDITTGFGTRPDHPDEPPGAWDKAAGYTRKQLAAAARDLQLPAAAIRTNRGVRPSSGLATRMDRAAAQLRTGRELLQTHFTSAPDGTRQHHSELAAPLASPAIRRTLLAELGDLAEQAAQQTHRIANAPAWRRATGPRRSLSDASARLRLTGTRIRDTQKREPLPAGCRDLLYAIPASMLPPRRAPRASDTIAALREGAVSAALRTRRAIWQTATQPRRPASITSLRETAAAAVLISHHCEILLQGAAYRAAIYFPHPDASREIDHAAAEAAACRRSWLSVAHALSQLTTEKRAKATDVARETGSLAMWTGRLAYADPAWTLNSGPSHEPRTGRALIPDLADIPKVIATVHHAIDILEPAATAEHDQVSGVALAGEFLLPAHPARGHDRGRTMGQAPDAAVIDLIVRYRNARDAGKRAAAAMSRAATSAAAPSRILATARRASGPQPPRPPRPRPDAANQGLPSAGRHSRGANIAWLTERAIAMDRAAEQLMLATAARAAGGRARVSAETQSHSPGCAAIVGSVLTLGQRPATAVPGTRQPRQEVPEREP